MSDQHASLIKTPQQLIAIIVLSFVVPVAVIVLLATYVAGAKRASAGSGSLTPEAVADRLKPVGTVVLFTEPAAPAPAQAAKPEAPAAAPVVNIPPPVAAAAPVAVKAGAGEALYKQACTACHVAGVAGAPKSGDKAAWAPRIKLGIDALTASVIKGKGAMPARGAAAAASDAEIRAAVEYMVSQAR